MGGCDRLPFVQNDQGAIPRAKFVNTVVALRRAAAQSPSPAVYASQKAELFAQTGVSENDLKKFINVHGSDAVYMSSVWDTIASRLEKPQTPSKAQP
jgi:hypothetical protein